MIWKTVTSFVGAAKAKIAVGVIVASLATTTYLYMQIASKNSEIGTLEANVATLNADKLIMEGNVLTLEGVVDFYKKEAVKSDALHAVASAEVIALRGEVTASNSRTLKAEKALQDILDGGGTHEDSEVLNTIITDKLINIYNDHGL